MYRAQAMGRSLVAPQAGPFTAAQEAPGGAAMGTSSAPSHPHSEVLASWRAP